MNNSFAGEWSKLKPALHPWILNVVSDLGFSQMTPVQAGVIPLFMQHKDVVVEAVTGSGKTLSFVIPILEKLLRREDPLGRNEIGAIIISPTRELATQICKVIEKFVELQETPEEDAESSQAPTRGRINPPLLLVGGNSLHADISNFNENQPQILVGTPGRLEEFLLGSSSLSKQQKKQKLTSKPTGNVRNLEMLVLDEADRLLDLGFAPTINRIFDYLPKQRRTGLFSATMTDSLTEVVRAGLRNPVKIVVKVHNKQSNSLIEENRTPLGLKNTYIITKPDEKLYRLLTILKQATNSEKVRKFIVYFSTCACVDYFYKLLSKTKALQHVYSLHGQMSPTRRANTFSNFVALPPNETGILLCTDVAARGIDLPDVDCVIQFDPPVDTRAFGHRVGRTARAGNSGLAVVLLCESEVNYVEFLRIRKMVLKNATSDYPVTDKEELERHRSEVRDIILSDRDIHDLSMKAFVSFIRSYSKHEASFIFQIKTFDYISAAKVYGLLKLPSMPELKDVNLTKWHDAELNWDKYAYADASKEKNRKKQLAEGKRRENIVSVKKKATAWSHKEEEKAKKEQKREQRVKRAQHKIENDVQSSDEEDEATKRDWKEEIKEQKAARKRKREAPTNEQLAEFMSGLA